MPQIPDMHFQTFSFNLRPILVEFLWASSEGRWRKKEDRRRRRIAV